MVFQCQIHNINLNYLEIQIIKIQTGAVKRPFFNFFGHLI